jgi:hypothetical protein
MENKVDGQFIAGPKSSIPLFATAPIFTLIKIFF